MLDFRLETFLTLCETRSFTRTAEILHITQPAVSQHIKFLEKKYNTKLFVYELKTLSLTKKGEAFRNFALSMRANSTKIYNFLQKPDTYFQEVNFGATLSIGEYVMSNILKNYLKQHTDHNLYMTVDNTSSLLQKLNHGEIDFALVEGKFPKSDYGYKLLSKEKFIPICSSISPLCKGVYTLDDITKHRLIIREKGSGTRSILENTLQENSLSLDSFKSIVETSNFSIIKQLVSENIGITFAFQEVVKEELYKKTLSIVDISNFNILREFNFVYLKNSTFERYYIDFFNYCKNHRNKNTSK